MDASHTGHWDTLLLQEGLSTGCAGGPRVLLLGDQEQDSCVVPNPSLPIPICCTVLGPVANELCRSYRGRCLNPNDLASQGLVLLPLPACLAFAIIKSSPSLVEPLLSSWLSDNQLPGLVPAQTPLQCSPTSCAQLWCPGSPLRLLSFLAHEQPNQQHQELAQADSHISPCHSLALCRGTAALLILRAHHPPLLRAQQPCCVPLQHISKSALNN